MLQLLLLFRETKRGGVLLANTSLIRGRSHSFSALVVVDDVVCPAVAVLDVAFAAGDADDADAGVGICATMVEPLVAREENDGPVER